VALEKSLPVGAIAPRRNDTSVFCGFSEFDRLDEAPRSLIAVSDAEVAALVDYRVISGHFSLPTLLGLAPASSIATILREPRTRLLSAYMFLRLTPIVRFWGPYGDEVLNGAAQSLEVCFSDSLFAGTSDNQICRLILRGDPRVREGEFVASSDVSGLAETALEQLDLLGYVGILEQDDIWGDMSGFFGVPLTPERTNMSGADEIPDGALPIPPFDMKVVLELIEQRSRADRLVYEALLARRCGSSEEARRIADAAFAAELVRFGDLGGTSATKLTGLAGSQSS
jgi:hypothetical protein